MPAMAREKDRSIFCDGLRKVVIHLVRPRTGDPAGRATDAAIEIKYNPTAFFFFY
jgi:hypothetical protein